MAASPSLHGPVVELEGHFVGTVILESFGRLTPALRTVPALDDESPNVVGRFLGAARLVEKLGELTQGLLVVRS